MKGRYNATEKAVEYQAAPGLYNIPDTKCKKGTLFKMGNKNKQNNDADSPSPFSYDPTPTTLK